MTRAARQVAREMARLKPGETVIEGSKRALPVYIVDKGLFQRWLLLLAPPIKRRKVTKATRSRRATTRELDQLCREVVFLRDGGKCRRCGRSDGLMDWAHVYSRRHAVTRWALSNSMVLCRGCHLWWHQSPTEAVTWWTGEVGEEAMKKLELMKRASKSGPPETVKLYLEAERRKYA